ncbi:4'-phosphopantetheinyl transferase superfamily protein, partial [bacterium]
LWSSVSPEFALPPGEVHVWRAELDVAAKTLAELRGLLSEDERARADRFVRAEDRLRFTAARGLLRRPLGWYLQTPSEKIRFAYGPQGRPELAAETPGVGLRFNLSHSGEIVLIAFARDREVGVDVEALRAPVDEAALARRYFRSEESARLAELPEAERRREFFRLWTRKEALLKAKGLGVRAIEIDPEADPEFVVLPLELEEGYAAALAYRRPEARLGLFRWV